MFRILLCSAFSTVFLCGCAARTDSVQVKTARAGQAIPVALALPRVTRPDGCFVFDRFGPQGWRVRGIFDGGDPNTQISTCGPIDMAAITTAVAEMADPLKGIARLTMPLGPGCFPNNASSGFWAFDIISPNLENRTGWAGQNAFTFRINSFDALIVPNGLQVQALMRVRKPDGTESFFSQLNANGQPRFEGVPAGWSQFSWQFAVPAGSVPLSVHIRIFGVPALRTSDIAVQIDGVCPGL